jgi:hypothetical protein
MLLLAHHACPLTFPNRTITIYCCASTVPVTLPYIDLLNSLQPQHPAKPTGIIFSQVSGVRTQNQETGFLFSGDSRAYQILRIHFLYFFSLISVLAGALVTLVTHPIHTGCPHHHTD